MADTRHWRRLAADVLTTAEPAAKCAAAARAQGGFAFDGSAADDAILAPDTPARPERPRLLPPQMAPRRRLGSIEGRVALLHALAHIELNAVDLAFDMALRFETEVAAAGLDSQEFVRDWVAIGAEEAVHFGLLDERLQALGSGYGALPAHGALWEAAANTADSVLARLAIAPLVLEARGLDVTPLMAARLRNAGDEASALILYRIFNDEIAHVGAGARWFERLCKVKGVEPEAAFGVLVAERFKGGLKPPFNQTARSAAGIPEAFYAGWNEACDKLAKRPPASERRSR